MSDSFDIAIIGMGCRFPEANSPEAFWQNLITGKESIRHFSRTELLANGYVENDIDHPDFVAAKAILEDYKQFDNHLFGYLKDEVDKMDPQCRLLHECCWLALEDAAYTGRDHGGRMGLFAGAASNIPWISALMKRRLSPAETFDIVNWNLPESLITRTAYRLGLRGPVMAIHTACSTSLVAIHTACQSILSGDCDMALAGGVSLTLPQVSGYRYQQGMVRSADGHCRPFDKDSNGTVGGSGAGILLLKALDQAIEDNDHIHAVIKGSAINNDGQRKPGFTAPSVQGQSEVIANAQMLAGVEPRDITYIECHGTATEIGDPIEVTALNRVFGGSEHVCMIGSVKSNIGHLDEAAGVASVIKTVMSLQHKQLAPSLHYTQPNDKLHLEDTPFRVVERPMDWVVAEDKKRIAGVSSFGIGGTNAHVILAEADDPIALPPDDDSLPKVLLISAETPRALQDNQQNLADSLQSRPDMRLSDVAFVLQEGRIHHRFRKAIVAGSREEAIRSLHRPLGAVKKIASGEQHVVFLFPGQGAQYRNMALELYESHDAFRAIVDDCLALASERLGGSLRDKWFGSSEGDALQSTRYAQPAIFIVEYALARCLVDVDVQPSLLLGYSFGELVAATVAGVFTLQDAIELVVTRGELMQALPPGAMLSVPLPVADVAELCSDGISVAIDNKDSCVVSGAKEDINAFAVLLKNKRIMTAPIKSSHAAHSPAMKQINGALQATISRFTLNAPSIPLISSVTGEPLTAEQAVSVEYWTAQAESPVCFVKGIEYLVENYRGCLFIEVGVGRDLLNLTRRYVAQEDSARLITLLPEESRVQGSRYSFWGALGKIWQQGVGVAWERVRFHQDCRRVAIPGYAFDRSLFWPEKADFLNIFSATPETTANSPSVVRKENRAEWLYQHAWKQQPLNMASIPSAAGAALLVRLSSDASHTGCLYNRLQAHYSTSFRVRLGKETRIDLSEESQLRAGHQDDFIHFFEQLKAHKTVLDNVIIDGVAMDCEGDVSLCAILHLLQAYRLQKVDIKKITLLVNHGATVSHEQTLCPAASALMAIATVVRQEFPETGCQAIDVGDVATDCPPTALVADIVSVTSEPVVWRAHRRWVRDFVPYQSFGIPDGKVLKPQGTYLLVGGAGFIGKTFCAHLAKNYQANLIVTSRSKPPRDEIWDDIELNATSLTLLQADVSDEEAITRLVSQAVGRHGRIDGIFYLAGITGEASLRSIIETDDNYISQHLTAKKEGIAIFDRALAEQDYDFCLVVSSLAPILGGLGFYAYAAASAWLDAFVTLRNRTSKRRWTLVNWDGWEVAARTEVHHKVGSSLAHLLISREEGVALLPEVIRYAERDALIISTADIKARLAQWTLSQQETSGESSTSEDACSERPDLDNVLVAPRNAMETQLVSIWQDFLHIRPLGIDDDFFDLGGNSLKAITLLSQVHKHCHIDVPLTRFFKHPTIRELAEYAKDHATAANYLEIKPAESQDTWPLSPGQRRLYLQQMFNKNSVAYNETVAFRIVGNLDVDRFNETLYQLMQRHESLRTTIVLVNGEPRQYCHPSPIAELHQLQIDREECSESHLQAEVKKLIKPFNLHQDVLIRLLLIKLKVNDYLFFLDLHHIISDGLSQDIFVRDFLTIYQGNTLPPLPIQYKDYTMWQRQFAASKEVEAQKNFWIDKLQQLPELPLPLDVERGSEGDERGGRLYFSIDRHTTKRLEQLYCGDGVTRFMVFLSTYYLLLADVSHQTRFAIGTPMLGRPQRELQDVIGIFVNLLPVPCDFHGEMSFREIVNAMKEVTITVFDHSDIQFEQIVQALGLRPRKNRLPIFDTVFSYMNIGMADFELPGLKLSRFALQEDNSRFDLAMLVKETEGDFEFSFEYKRALFRDETIAGFITRYTTLLEKIISSSDVPINEHISKETVSKVEGKGIELIDFNF
ncbi:type I polyketide synthase [Pectobacterium odoriferum]|uniref:type I polyketide synthase n=1 Tax=Pectobacterium odoriferum TaxID=78398 RepID=UPI0005C5190F|nr:type I polyketide synthase [Pectobacterium odoriferum]